LSRWLMEVRSLPRVAPQHPKQRTWDVAQKARIVAQAVGLEGDELATYLEQEGVKLVELEGWRAALDDRETSSIAMTRRVRSLERELARKERALAEAAALLLLKKKVDLLYQEAEDDDTDKENDK
jgi:transposase